MATNTGILDLVKPAGNENALISVINSNMDKVDAEAGRQRGNIAANYSTSSAYDVGDLCIYQGNLYRCNTAIASGEEWTAAHWTQVNIAGELDSQKQDITSNTQAIANIESKISNNGVLLATFTGATQEKTLAEAITHFKFVLLVAYFISGGTSFAVASTIVPVSLEVTNIIACLNDGTIRKVQVTRNSDTKFTSAGTNGFQNITGAYLYGVDRISN